VVVTILVLLLGFVAISMLGEQIDEGGPAPDLFEATGVFEQPDTEWNTSILVSKSPETREIRRLTWLVVMIAIGIFVVVETLLIFAMIKYRKRKGEVTGEPVQMYGSSPVELAWTVIPILIVVALCLTTIRTIQSVQPTLSERPENALTVEAIGHRWWWEFRIPEYDVVTANEVSVPAGRPIWLELGSADVIHSFWVPELQGKMDAIPVKTNYWGFTADEPGIYLGQCAEYCGTQHANMLIRIVALDEQGFETWAAEQASPPVDLDDEQVVAGRKAFLRYACRNCHGIAGVSDGTFAPDLTHLMSRTLIAGGMLPNNIGNLKAWIEDPQKVKPGCDMPALQLTKTEIEDVAAYLATLK
jgi:cytochrome c oxidase subunit 2